MSDDARTVRHRVGALARERRGFLRTFTAVHEAAMAPGALDSRTKELIALAIAVATRCEDCVALHVRAGREAGATRDEMLEALEVAVLMGGGPALMYAARAREVLDAELGEPGAAAGA